MFEKNLSIPVFFHIPKNAGSFVLNRFFVYSLAFNKTKQHLNKRIDVIKDGKVCYRLVVIEEEGECDNNKVFHKKTPRNYEIQIEDLTKELLDRFFIFSLIISGDGFNSYKEEIYPLLPADRAKHELITLRESFSRAKSFYFYLQGNSSEHERLHGRFDGISFEDYLSSHQVEDCWAIRFFTKLDLNKEISEKEFNEVCSLMDEMDVVYYKDIDSYLYRFFKKTHNIDSLKHKNIFEVREVYDNKNKNKSTISFSDLKDDTTEIFNKRTYWDQKLFSRYINKTPKPKNENPKHGKGKIINCFYDESENGFGDFLRGSIHLFNHCASKDLDFDIDLSKHSICKFFDFQSTVDQDYSIEDFYLRAVPTQNFIYQLKKQTENILNSIKTGEYRYIFSNFHPCLLTNNIIKYQNSIPTLSKKCRDWFVDKLKPNKTVEEETVRILKENNLEENGFDIMHFRFSDQESFSENFDKSILSSKYEQAITKCISKHEQTKRPVLVLSNSNDFKKYLMQKNKDFLIATHLQSVHTQETPCGFDGKIKKDDSSLLYTVIDMNLCRFANTIESHSYYNHGSGFLYWFCKIHNKKITLSLF